VIPLCTNTGYASLTGNQQIYLIGCDYSGLIAPTGTPNSNRGGAVCVVASTTSLFVNVTFFTNNSASGQGGALYFDGSSFESEKNIFDSNKSPLHPTSRIMITSISLMEKDQIIFATGSSATNGDENVEIYNTGSINLNENNISFCVMGIGAYHTSSYIIEGGTKARLMRISIINNTSSYGTLYSLLTGTHTEIKYSNFALNYERNSEYGLLRSAGDAVLTVRDCLFIYNTAYSLFNNAATMIVINPHIGWNSFFLLSNGAAQFFSFQNILGTLDLINIGPSANYILSTAFTDVID
jgi:predicted outer membrane repeat protein